MSPRDTGDLRSWVAAREPPVPDAFIELVDETAPVGERAIAESLLAEARSALRDALTGNGERRGAFRLLAADAYLTYACELALEAPDPADGLKHIVTEVVAEAEVG